jgi:uncharacterized YccA/Bax inhibitor family protein
MAPANRGSFGSSSNYQRMAEAYGPARPGGSTALLDAPPPVPTSTRTFTADGAFNKAGLLGVLALAVGAVAYAADLPIGAVWVLMVVALGAGLWASFRPARAKVLAPVFAVCEGAVLGALAVVVGVWFCYRTGLVRVGHRFIQTLMIASVGLLAVMIVAILTGWGASGLGGVIVFGVLYLVLAVMNLFVDYDFAYRAEASQLSADAEWYSAFSLLLSSAMVYLALLRIFGGRR